MYYAWHKPRLICVYCAIYLIFTCIMYWVNNKNLKLRWFLAKTIMLFEEVILTSHKKCREWIFNICSRPLYLMVYIDI